MKRAGAEAAGRFAAKGLGLAAQLATLALVAEALGARDFGRYSLVLAIAAVVAQLADFGTGRFQFRRAHRGSPAAMLAMWSLAFRLLGAGLLLPLLLFYAWRTGLPGPALAFGFVANILFQFANLNRHLLLLDERVGAAILVESAPALFFCAGIAACLAASVALDVNGVLLLFLSAMAAGFACSAASSGTAGAWVRGVAMLWRTPARRVLAGVGILARRSSLIGVEIFLAAASFNAPILIVAALDGGAATPQVALYQRILGLEVALLSVTVTARLKAYHDCGKLGVLDGRPALASAVLVFAANAAGLLLLAPLVQLLPESRDITLIGIALSLRPHLLLVAAVAACTAANLHCSMSALGGNWLWPRCLSVGAGLLATTAVAASLVAKGAEPFAAVLQGSLIGQLTALTVLIAGVTREGGRIHLPWSLPWRSPAGVRA
ncbi:hypothetical protein LK533_02385 [Sphingomonas sp. PL-96]|uniref:hypothetical protein n=1 Tax=Sphingomonas sp. PL-96 TaxID=2887201 RepID=UPI001E36D58F|nr:hypothetical protein [Sphingomonas sp. PL-96]MCC2975521.1 hypothetical protein [Sphingomonas sp. PL-96]